MDDLFQQNLRVIQVRFDGGCKPNPGAKYGSYEIMKVRDKHVIARATRFTLGFGTNNEAEFESLITALERLHQWVDEFHYDPLVWKIRVVTDSTIVRNHLLSAAKPLRSPDTSNVDKVIAARRRDAMIERANRCKNLLRKFGAYEAQWETRENNVEVFGH